jgi:hypothetical protein
MSSEPVIWISTAGFTWKRWFRQTQDNMGSKVILLKIQFRFYRCNSSENSFNPKEEIIILTHFEKFERI